jgi:hypothetical protein
MYRRFLTAFGAATLSFALIAGVPGYGQEAATKELRAEVSNQLEMANIEVEGGVETLSDQQVMEIKQALGDQDCCDAERREAVMRIISSN